MSDEWGTPTERRLTAELDALSVAAMGRPGALTVDVLDEILQDRIDAQRECVRLDAELAELRAACEPLRKVIDARIQAFEATGIPVSDNIAPLYWSTGTEEYQFTYGDFRRIAALLGSCHDQRGS